MLHVAISTPHRCCRFIDDFEDISRAVELSARAIESKHDFPLQRAAQDLVLSDSIESEFLAGMCDDTLTWVKSYLIALGTNYIIKGKRCHIEMAATIAFLHNTLLSVNNIDDQKRLMRRRDLFQGDERDVIRYFYRRAMCSCLKDTWKRVKAGPKTGWCYRCYERKERKDLMVCGACRVSQYCSKRCQGEDWPRHQAKCIGCKNTRECPIVLTLRRIEEDKCAEEVSI